MRRLAVAGALASLSAAVLVAQTAAGPDWSQLEGETLRHFQALVRLDTSNPPGNEKLVTEYVKAALAAEGIDSKVDELEPNRPSLIARVKGNGRKRPLLLMGHSDVVTVDPKKWTFPPFSATRDGGYIYGRGTLDDKPHVVAGLMTLVELKRLNVPLDRDVIFLVEAGEEGTSHLGIDFVVDRHFADIDAEYCMAEGGGVTRVDGKAKYASVQTTEKLPRAVELRSKGTAGHGSRPLQDNAVVHLASAVAAAASWRTPLQVSETTGQYFKRLAEISTPEEAKRYRDVLTLDTRAAKAADEYFLAKEPGHASMLRTSISPTIIGGGYRTNVIPSEATATLDVRLFPGDDPDAFLAALKKVINDPWVTVAYSSGHDERPPSRVPARLDSEAFKAIENGVAKHYQAPVLPTMSTGATDMAQLRAKGIQCYGMGPAVDRDDAQKGFGAHSDQERILESEMYRFVRFQWDVVMDLARAK